MFIFFSVSSKMALTPTEIEKEKRHSLMDVYVRVKRLPGVPAVSEVPLN
jgi:hypothetical protein